MNFERMTDDELKRFLLLRTECIDWAVAVQEAARRWTAYEQEDIDTAEEEAYEEGHQVGYDRGYDKGYDKGYEAGLTAAESE